MKKISAVAVAAALFAAQFGFADAASADARSACRADFRRLCADVPRGGGRAAQCLKDHESELSSECKKALDEMKAEKAQSEGTANSGSSGQ